MPESYVARSVLTSREHNQIRNDWERLQEALLICLRECARLEQFEPQRPPPTSWTLRVKHDDPFAPAEAADLRALFERFGPVASVSVDAEGGFAWVSFFNRRHALDAVHALHYRSCYGYTRLRLDTGPAFYDAEKPEMTVGYEYGPGHAASFVVSDPAMRATVDLAAMRPAGAALGYDYVLVVVTSWALDAKWKIEVEAAKEVHFGPTLGARVLLAYDTCEPPTEAAMDSMKLVRDEPREWWDTTPRTRASTRF